MSLSFAVLHMTEDGVITQAYSPSRQTSGWITVDLLLCEYSFITCGVLGRAKTEVISVTNMLDLEVM